MKTLALAVAFWASLTALGADYYVSTTGASNNLGTIASPWNLASAILNVHNGNQHPVTNGDTIWMRGGTYTGGTGKVNYKGAWMASGSDNSFLNSTDANNPITVRPYPGESVAWDHWAYLLVTNVVFRNIEFMTTETAPDPTLTRDQIQTKWGDGTYDRGSIETGNYSILVNCIIHDGYSSSAVGPAYACIFLNGGSWGIDAASGHGLYEHGGAVKTLSENIVGNNFLNGFNIYSAAAADLDNLVCSNNIAFGNGKATGGARVNFFIGNGLPLTGDKVVGNWIVGDLSTASATFQGMSNGCSITGNKFVFGQAGFSDPIDVFTFSGNEVVAQGPGMDVITYYSTFTNSVAWNNNSYYAGSFATPFNYDISGSKFGNFTQWKAWSGFDAGSTFTTTAKSGVETFVHTNIYEAGRAHVGILNWSSADNVTIDLSSVGLSVGQTYYLWVLQDFANGTRITNVWTGANVTVPMTNWGVAQPRSLVAAVNNSTWHAAHPTIGLLSSTFPQFGAFLLTSESAPVHASSIVRANKIHAK